MNLYLLEQEINNNYDTFDSAVVAASSPLKARRTHPDDCSVWENIGWMRGGELVPQNPHHNTWVAHGEVEGVEVTYLGHTKLEAGVVCASFNAG